MTIFPIEFQPRGAVAADRHIHAPMPIESAASNRVRCPGSNKPVAAPVASTYMRATLAEDVWYCSGCGLEWRSGFDGLRS